MHEGDSDKAELVLSQATNLAGRVDCSEILTAEELDLASEDFRWLKDRKAESTGLVEAIIKPIREGLDKLYLIRRNIEAIYDKPMNDLSVQMGEYRSREKEELEAKALEIVETAVEKDVTVGNLPEPAKPSGVSFREQWSALVVDQAKLVDAVSVGQPGTSLELLKPNMTALNQLARTLKSELDRMDIGVVSQKREVVITR